MSHLKTLSEPERVALSAALILAVDQYADSAAELDKVAAHLRSGGDYPLFAPGETGAIAADRLAEQFRRQAETSRKISEIFDVAREVRVVLDEDES